jgi:hypothetical protein
MYEKDILSQCSSCGLWLYEKEPLQHIKTHEQPTLSTMNDTNNTDINEMDEAGLNDDDMVEAGLTDDDVVELALNDDDDMFEPALNDDDMFEPALNDDDMFEPASYDDHIFEQALNNDDDEQHDALDLDLQSVASHGSNSTYSEEGTERSFSDDDESESSPPLMLTFDNLPLQNTFMQHMGLIFGELATKHKFKDDARKDMIAFTNKIVEYIRPGKITHCM